MIIIHQLLSQLIKHDTTQECLDQLVKQVTMDFNTDYYQQWADAVKKYSWWFKTKNRIISELADLIMKHQMVSNLVFLIIFVLLIFFFLILSWFHQFKHVSRNLLIQCICLQWWLCHYFLQGFQIVKFQLCNKLLVVVCLYNSLI